jgi:predicted TPR repeat methyltransferase
LSCVLETLGNLQDALVVLTDGIALCPTNVTIRNAAILLCIRRRDFSQAARLAEDARATGIANACTFGMKGHALASLGSHDEAAAAYRDALKLDPEDPHVRQLALSSSEEFDPAQPSERYIRTVFDSYADQFENHMISLGYSIPAVIRSILQKHPKIIAGMSLGPVLDLGCGTGLVALAIGDLPLGPITGIDLSPRMLAHAHVKRIYAELRECDILTDLTTHDQHWPLIVAADVLCYFGPLDQILAQIHKSLLPGGWFVFSVEKVLPDHDGIAPGNGRWALQRQGRYAHDPDYVYETACAAGFRVSRADHPVIRQEAGAPVPGLLLTLERVRHDD